MRARRRRRTRRGARTSHRARARVKRGTREAAGLSGARAPPTACASRPAAMGCGFDFAAIHWRACGRSRLRGDAGCAASACRRLDRRVRRRRRRARRQLRGGRSENAAPAPIFGEQRRRPQKSGARARRARAPWARARPRPGRPAAQQARRARAHRRGLNGGHVRAAPWRGRRQFCIRATLHERVEVSVRGRAPRARRARVARRCAPQRVSTGER